LLLLLLLLLLLIAYDALTSCPIFFFSLLLSLSRLLLLP